jgi:hypothetical protein
MTLHSTHCRKFEAQLGLAVSSLAIILVLN